MSAPSSTSLPAQPFISATLCSLSVLESSSAQHELSDKLLASFKSEVQNSTKTMLPSYIYRLPTGSEVGHAVGIDLGGSTLRVALISFPQREVLRRQVWKIEDTQKRLPAKHFFDWVAERVKIVVGEEGSAENGNLVPVGLTWSFPMDQTSLWSGNVKTMGKGYLTHEGIEGSDLREHFHEGFHKQVGEFIMGDFIGARRWITDCIVGSYQTHHHCADERYRSYAALARSDEP